MTKLLLFGATGNVGKAIAQEAKQQGYDLTIVVRHQNKANDLAHITANYIVADVTNPASLIDICQGFDIVISALGKSVSINDKSKPSFNDVDFLANANILREAQKSGVKKFIYISAFHAEKYVHLEYFRVHHAFAEQVKQSGINYAIIKPPAVFSAFVDMIDMAKKGQLANMGNGDKKTNPIYEGDLAKICIDAIKQNNSTIEAGGKKVYTRKELNNIIQKAVNPNKKVRHIPMGLLKFSLPFIKIFNKNMFDKFAFFIEVMQHDTLAPPVGEMKFEAYITAKTKSI